jgi:hypothetical protein
VSHRKRIDIHGIRLSFKKINLIEMMYGQTSLSIVTIPFKKRGLFDLDQEQI